MRRLAFVLLLAACSNKAAEDQGPTCAVVTDHVLEIARITYPGHGDMGGAGNRKAQIEQCEVRKMPAVERRCMMAAKTLEALAECRRRSLGTEGSASK
jgi:hypothetical protein